MKDRKVTPRLSVAMAVAEVLGVDPKHPGTRRLAIALGDVADAPPPFVETGKHDAVLHKFSDRRSTERAK